MSTALSPEEEARLQVEVRTVGLSAAYARFPDDVRTAFRAAERLRRGLGADLPPAEEPCPVLRVDGAR